MRIDFPALIETNMRRSAPYELGHGCVPVNDVGVFENELLGRLLGRARFAKVMKRNDRPLRIKVIWRKLRCPSSCPRGALDGELLLQQMRSEAIASHPLSFWDVRCSL